MDESIDDLLDEIDQTARARYRPDTNPNHPFHQSTYDESKYYTSLQPVGRVYEYDDESGYVLPDGPISQHEQSSYPIHCELSLSTHCLFRS